MENLKSILLKYDKSTPRYTSYPPANYFYEKLNNDDLINNILISNDNGDKNISIYIHIPFCKQKCYFCGCNSSKYENEQIIGRYIDCIITEIQNLAKYIDVNKRTVTQIHWGGGTPNSIKREYISKVMDIIRKTFVFNQNIEIAIECNPAYLDKDLIIFLSKLGFNRISIGIQDFNKNVLHSINRSDSKIPYNELIGLIKEYGFESINFDFVYGLPNQTIESFCNTINKAIELSPDRLVTFSYAHIPWLMTEQKKLEDAGLPSPDEKLSMFLLSRDLLIKSGYEQIGFDHYAKSSDDLVNALKKKKLHRNFQGYCTKETTGQVYGIGSSSISQMWNAYCQNEKNINSYMNRIEKEGFAVERGYVLSFEERVCKEVINEAMCNGLIDFEIIAEQFSISIELVKDIIEFNEDKFLDYIKDNLINLNNNKINISKEGMLIVRNIAMELDPIFGNKKSGFSKTI